MIHWPHRSHQGWSKKPKRRLAFRKSLVNAVLYVALYVASPSRGKNNDSLHQIEGYQTTAWQLDVETNTHRVSHLSQLQQRQHVHVVSVKPLADPGSIVLVLRGAKACSHNQRCKSLWFSSCCCLVAPGHGVGPYPASACRLQQHARAAFLFEVWRPYHPVLHRPSCLALQLLLRGQLENHSVKAGPDPA